MVFSRPDIHTTRPVIRGSFGTVASSHWLATATGQSVLERGGNAFDAAAAAAFVLHVVEPHLNGPGGDLSLIFQGKDDLTPQVVCGQGPTPAGATAEHFAAQGLDLVPGAGALAATVPGAVPAWLMLLRTRGTWDIAKVLAYATGYARDGHPLLPSAVRTIAAVRPLFEDHWQTSAAQWLPGGELPKPHELFINAAYARTLERLVEAADSGADQGREARIGAVAAAWSTGFVAEAIDRAMRVPHLHSSGTDHSGVLRASDLAAFIPGMEEAVSIDFRGVTVAKTGAWGQGPVLLQMLSILATLPDERLDPGTELGAHTILEAMKLALADRDAYYGDPAANEAPVPLEVLLSSEYGRQRAAMIGETASAEFRPGMIAGYSPHFPPLVAELDDSSADEATGEPTVRVSGAMRGDTCHLDVVDRWGTIIAATPSGGWLQSSPTIPELGFCVGTRLQMSWIDGASPSRLRPGRRPRTTLSPTLLLVDGVPVTALGTPGGDQQDQWQLLYLLRTIVGGYDPQEAIDAAMFHSTHLVGSFWPRSWVPAGAVVEVRLGADVTDGLRRRGHRVTTVPDWTLGRLSMAGQEHGILVAAATSRGGQAYAAGR
jgi:gamma-glutamyltranspeptidase/glutathione hydrolase